MRVSAVEPAVHVSTDKQTNTVAPLTRATPKTTAGVDGGKRTAVEDDNCTHHQYHQHHQHHHYNFVLSPASDSQQNLSHHRQHHAGDWEGPVLKPAVVEKGLYYLCLVAYRSIFTIHRIYPSHPSIHPAIHCFSSVENFTLHSIDGLEKQNPTACHGSLFICLFPYFRCCRMI